MKRFVSLSFIILPAVLLMQGALYAQTDSLRPLKVVIQIPEDTRGKNVLLQQSAISPQTDGALTPDMLAQIQQSFKLDAPSKAMLNAVTANNIKSMALDRSTAISSNTHFSHKIKTEGITNQKSSGRCWLFAGLNIMRPVAMTSLNKKGFEFSQNYLFFYDKLEKANLFLEAIIRTAEKPTDEREVEWLLNHALPDGGQWNLVIALIEKYGVVPADVMPETESSSNTGTMNAMISRKLHQDAAMLRQMHQQGIAGETLQRTKLDMLKEVYRMLVFHLGIPPASFEWRYEDKDGKVTDPVSYTPQEFYKKFVNLNLDDYVCLHSVPSKQFNKLYQIQYNRDLFDKPNMTFANVQIDKLKELTLKSVLANDPVWFGCDVGKESDSKTGVMKVGLYDYESIYGVSLKLSKADRVLYQESVPSHAMVFIGVDVVNGKPEKWLVENSWGATAGNNGTFTMYDSWYDEYMFAIVIHKKYLPKDVLDIFKQKAEMLPPWDPMFSMWMK
jgi:bleomycin hydrolase